MTKRLLPFLAAFFLFAATLALFWPAVSFSMVNFDDPVFITHNPIVADGFSWRSIPRAFTALHADRCMYTPLLWLSWLADTVLFRASISAPAGFHLGNVLLHAANAVLLFFVLRLCTHRTLPALFAAAFWALHPFRVESVAWITERKDTLSTFFALLSILFYLKAWERGRPARDGGSEASTSPSPHSSLVTRHCHKGCRLLALVAFVAGLLSKPMLVTLPFLFLLLDFWPLCRFSLRDAPRALPRLALENWPFFVLSLFFAILTRMLQTGAVSDFSLLTRLYWLPTNYLFYLAKSVWPVALLPQAPGLPVNPAFVATSLFILLALAALALSFLRRCPGFAVGLAAFAGLLFPVSGIVIVGEYPVADRYSYLPAIGLSIALAALLGLLPECGRPGSGPRSSFVIRHLPFAILLCALFALALATRRYLPVWRDSDALYARIAAFLPDHFGVQTIRFHKAFAERNDLREAADAAARLAKAIPDHPYAAFANIVLLSQTDSSQAALDYFAANPPDETRHRHLSDTLHLALAALSADVGDDEGAVRHIELAGKPTYDDTASTDLFNASAAWILWRTGRPDDALSRVRRVSTLSDASALSPETLLRPASAVWGSGLRRQTLPSLLQIAADSPSNPALLNNVAWLLATSTGSPADPADVLAIARRALSLDPSHPVLQDTLAVALAFAGRFDDAIALESSVAAFLRASSADDAPDMLGKVEKRIALFRSRTPFTEPSSDFILAPP